MSDMMKILGKNLVRIRNEKGMGGKELSVLMGLSEIELEGIEEGNCDVDVEFTYRVAAILKVGIEDLFRQDGGRMRVQDRIISKLDMCSESDLILIDEYICLISKK